MHDATLTQVKPKLDELRSHGDSSERSSDETSSCNTHEAGAFSVATTVARQNGDGSRQPEPSQLDLDQEHIEAIMRRAPGGAQNVQDICPLSPLQEGMLFHHLLNEQSDTYVLSTLFELSSREALDELVSAFQKVMDRHDILRSVVIWEGLPRPVQVVCRRTMLHAEQLALDPGRGPVEQLAQWMRPGRERLNLRQMRLVRLLTAADGRGERCYALLQLHHLLCDYQSWNAAVAEAMTIARHAEHELPPPAPYREYVEWALAKAGGRNAAAFFNSKLGEIHETTAPFGLTDVHGDGSRFEEARHQMEAQVAQRLRLQAQRLGVSVARVVHAAWALVLARTSGRDDIVFGTVLLASHRRATHARRMLGMFVNTLPLRVQLRDVTAEQLVALINSELSELLRHEQASLTLAQRCSGNGGVPLFTALLNCRRRSPDSDDEQGAASGIRLLARGEAWSNYPIAMIVDDLGDGFALTAQADRRIGASRIIEYLCTAVESLVAALEEAPCTPALSLSILPAAERQQLERFNATAAAYPCDKLVHEIFEEQVTRTPDAIAVLCDRQTATYAELNARANQLARYLRDEKVGPDQLVGICVERRLDMIVGLLAILKAGGAYLPLDPAYPLERLAYMLSDAAPRLLLTHERLKGRLPSTAAKIVALDDWSVVADRLTTNLTSSAPRPQPDHLAYVIYTSGSTGAPKGVMVEHRNLLNLIHWHCRAFDIREGSRCSCVAALGFDAATWEIWPTLSTGATLVLASSEEARDPEKLISWWMGQELDSSFLPTPVAEQVFRRVDHCSARFRTLLIGGDQLRHRPSSLPFRVVNNYGPTETTVVATSGRIEDDDPVLHIGRPIWNTQIHLLDANRKRVPVGVPGEIYIGGASVARGYLNRPELTAERFTSDPFSSEPGARLYRTGDLARWCSDGTLEYLGRNDDQVKIRGYRIELGEVQAQLARHPDVVEAVVVVREEPPRDKRLVAYIKLREHCHCDAHTLRSYLTGVLPDYMVPSAFVSVAAWPLTLNGKLDRRALPVPSPADYATEDYELPQGDVEEAIAGIWIELLAVSCVGRRDSFFRLGGDSLLAMQMTARVVELLGIQLPIRVLFEAPVLSEFAARAHELRRQHRPESRIEPDERAAQMQPIVRRPRSAADGPLRLPTSGAQQRLWFIDQMEGGSSAYHVPLSLRLRGELNLAALRAALDGIIARHEVLRTVIVKVDGELLQEIQPHRCFDLQFLDLTLLEAHEHGLQVARHSHEEVVASFSLGEGPLVRGRLLRLSCDEHVLLLTMHHIISDGWSIGVLIRELGALYEAHCDGRDDPLPALPIQYADYVQWHEQWLAGAQLQRQVRFWREHLEGAPELLNLPTDRPRPATRTYFGATARVALGTELSVQLKALCLKRNVTLAMLLHAAWTVVLSKLSGQDDIVVGMPVANRPRTELEDLIGFFVNTLAVRVRVARDATVQDLLEHVREVMLAAYANQDAPFERVVEELQPGRSLSYSPIFQVMFAMQNAPAGVLRSRLTLVDQQPPLETAKFDLSLSLQETADGIAGTVNYATDLFDRPTVERWITYFSRMLRGMAAGSQQAVSRLELMDDEERRQVVAAFNSTKAPYPDEKLIHELFEEQAQRKPDAIAVMCGDRSLSYGQLNANANQLARRLQQKGIRPDQPVALYVERSLEMIIGVLGILKAGGAYVPLDPDYPAARLIQTLEDALPRVILTQNDLRERLRGSATTVIALDSEWSDIAREATTNLDPRSVGLRSHHLAYVIYTSGSTGRPKGVMVEHRNVASLWHGLEHLYRQSRPCARIAVNAAITFDASVKQLVQLLSGRALVVVPQEIRTDASKLLAYIEQYRIDAIDCTPGQLSAWLSAGLLDRTNGHRLRVALVGGEPIDTKLWTRLARYSQTDFYNVYGPTESTVDTTFAQLNGQTASPHIGRPMENRYVYILDQHGQPVPIGVIGELTIGGSGIARGYLNRPDLTRERFLPDPFSPEPHARLYKSGDLARWRADGTIEYLGRNDNQVKIRGFRIELGDIEAQLLRDERVHATAVIAREDIPGDKRLVAYVVPSNPAAAVAVEELLDRLRAVLPEYMVPGAIVLLEKLPQTVNGKLDRRALPAPDLAAFASRAYESPQGEVEELLAGIWRSLLNVERVGRRDNFFELGGHSLLIMQMLERVRRVGLSADVRCVFDSSTLAELASAVTSSANTACDVPPNLIPAGCDSITPQMLPLVDLQDSHLESIVQAVPGGAANIQDIYPLAPLQEGILFHHLLNERGTDTYVVPILLSVCSRERLSELIAALQTVIERHDVLRTAILWEQLPQPVQVVYRYAQLPVEELVLDEHADQDGQVRQWLKPQAQRMDPRRAPLLRLKIAKGRTGQWYALLQTHHLTSDHVTLETVTAEVVAHLEGQARALPQPGSYRVHVAQALAYARTHDAETFFRRKLGDVDEPTAPFGLENVHEDVSRIEQARQALDPNLAKRIRAQARRMGVSAATLFHAAWALVVARTSGRDDVVFGSVLLGRLQGSAGAQRVMGMFINTLPLRIKLGSVTAKELVEQTQRELIELLAHEQASLSVAQRCSAIPGSAPLFTALFNFRHSVAEPEAQWSNARGIRMLGGRDWTNYPITVSVDDDGHGFAITAQTDRRIDPSRMTSYLHAAIESLSQALDQAPQSPALVLPLLPDMEREQVLNQFNATRSPYPREATIHELFEQQVLRTPHAVAVIHGRNSFTYAQINANADKVAQLLTRAGVAPGKLVGICVERSPEMVVGLLAILKAGAAYVPLDPGYPAERLQYMLDDAAPPVVLTHSGVKAALPATAAELIELQTDGVIRNDDLAGDLSPRRHRSSSADLVYVIYTSGSTGRPKGVAMQHCAMANLLEWHRKMLPIKTGQRVLQFAALSFDVAFQEIFSTLCAGATLVLLDEWVRRDAQALLHLLRRQSIHRLFAPPLMLQSLAECCTALREFPEDIKEIITAGEQLRISPEIVGFFKRLGGSRLHNHYGPTETHVVTALTLPDKAEDWPTLPTIGRPIANTQIYILDCERQLAPIAVAGEIYIGGANVASGYRNQPDLSRERFLQNPFSPNPDARLYRTGDLGRWRADGTIEYLGRNDDQVKIRGYRIELGEIEAQLACSESVREAAVVMRAGASAEKRLVAYVVPRDPSNFNVGELRAQLRSALPEFMVPAAFVTVERMPVTPSGKLNRRALPAPEPDVNDADGREPPQGHVERTLAQIWQELLSVRPVSRDDDFFDIGGHSLLVLKMLFKINEALGCALRVADVYRTPKLCDLAAQLAGATAQDQRVDLSREAVLGEDVLPAAIHASTPAKTILFTGATGFVGRFLLTQLLQETDATLCCLVRAPTRHEASTRLREALVKWNLWREEFASRLWAVPGDLRQPRLGLDEYTYGHIARNVDSIYHCATSMNHLETYAMARAANVEAVKELLRLATLERTKVVNYISSMGVFGPSTTGMTRVVNEATSIDHERHWSSRGYVASKWVGEKLCMIAGERGIPCNIFRVGLVWADSELGRYDELQRGYRILKSCLLSGCGIQSYQFEMPAAPVNYVARAVVSLANRHPDGGVFHICGAGQMLDRVFERCNEVAGTALELVPFYDWILEMKKLHEGGTSLPVVPLIEYAFGMDEESFYERQHLIRSSVRFEDERTRRILEQDGIVASALDDDLLRLCVDSMLHRDADLEEVAECAERWSADGASLREQNAVL